MEKKALKKLDLGCGKRKKKGCIGFDCAQLEGVDVVGDLNKTLPFDDNEFDVVYIDNVLEHIDDLKFTLREVYRITKSTGRIYVMVPYYNSPISFDDPTHLHQFTWKTLDFFTNKNTFWTYYFDFSFKIIQKRNVPSFIGSLFPNRIRVKLSNYIGNLILFLVYVLQPIKSESKLS